MADYRKPFFIKQLAGNACGALGLLHAVTNVAEHCGGYKPESFIDRFTTNHKDGTEKGTGQARGELLNEDAQFREIHNRFAKKGQSQQDHATRTHFVTYVNIDGHIWEVDGRREGPIHKGDAT